MGRRVRCDRGHGEVDNGARHPPNHLSEMQGDVGMKDQGERVRAALELAARQKAGTQAALEAPLPEPRLEDHWEPAPKRTRLRDAWDEFLDMPWGLKKLWVCACLFFWGALFLGGLRGSVLGTIILSPLLMLGLAVSIGLPQWFHAATTPFHLRRNTYGKYI